MKKIINYTLLTLSPLLFLNCGSSSSSTSQEEDTLILTPIINESNTSILNPIENDIPNNESELPSSENLPIETEIPISFPNNGAIELKYRLSDTIKESSGLIYMDNQLWTHNDSGNEAKLYQIDTNSGEILKTVTINNASNIDWEDISYDDNYIYIGDFGNNNGDRSDLKIYKIVRDELNTEDSIDAEVINFNYSDQTQLGDRDFDCEAMVVHKDKLYLFSKDWNDFQTRLYVLDTQAGTQTANYIESFNIQGLVTGATFNSELNTLLLSTYSTRLNVSIWSFSNFNNNFFDGESKQLILTPPLQAQVEGITFIDNNHLYLSSEAFSEPTYGISWSNNLYEVSF